MIPQNPVVDVSSVARPAPHDECESTQKLTRPGFADAEATTDLSKVASDAGDGYLVSHPSRTSLVGPDGNWQQQPPPLPQPGPYTVHAVQTAVLEGRTLTSAPVIINATIAEPAD